MSVELFTSDEMVNMLDVFGRVLLEQRQVLATDPAAREAALLLVEQIEVTVGPR